MMLRKQLIPMLCLLALCGGAWAQDEETGPVAPALPSPCSGAEYRQFDFWIGNWTVFSNDEEAGTNSVEPILGGCAIQENWQGTGPGGVSGTSFNIYDRANDQWHQTWVDSSGTLLELDGGLVAGSMVLQGERPAADGAGTATHRITFTPNPDGSVRQLWEASSDGETWTVLFDGLYKNAAPADETG